MEQHSTATANLRSFAARGYDCEPAASGPCDPTHGGMLPIVLTGSLEAGCSPVLRGLHSIGVVEIGLSVRSTVFVDRWHDRGNSPEATCVVGLRS
jgi:hypothetical protein